MHLLVIFEYPGTDFASDHFKGNISLYFSFYPIHIWRGWCHPHFFLLLNDVFWLLYCSSKFLSAVASCILSGLTAVKAMQLYIISSVCQLPSSGQLFLFLQLHWFFAVFFH